MNRKRHVPRRVTHLVRTGARMHGARTGRVTVPPAPILEAVDQVVSVDRQIRLRVGVRGEIEQERGREDAKRFQRTHISFEHSFATSMLFSFRMNACRKFSRRRETADLSPASPKIPTRQKRTAAMGGGRA